jgi:hypothetical protein
VAVIVAGASARERDEIVFATIVAGTFFDETAEARGAAAAAF